jgi:hypothetical protein
MLLLLPAAATAATAAAVVHQSDVLSRPRALPPVPSLLSSRGGALAAGVGDVELHGAGTAGVPPRHAGCRAATGALAVLWVGRQASKQAMREL